MNAAARMFALGFMAALAMTGCTTTPDYPQPAPDRAQIVVKVTATPKVGAQGPRTEGQYDKESVEKGRRFTRVNYSKMDCIAVVVRGTFAGNAPGNSTIQVGADGFDLDLFLATMPTTLGEANGRRGIGQAKITFSNSRDHAITLFGSAQGNDSAAMFEVKVPANGAASCEIWSEGLYDVYCDEDERLYCQILATYCQAMLCESGGEALFEGLEPGSHEIEVFAPRLPVWRAKINTTAGKRETLYAEVTVNSLPKAK